jgi:8-oxo-dGTP diphosphatase
MKAYVLGFVIHQNEVLLIEKERPYWQQGKLNGVGGSVEDGESPDGAMSREFREETGVVTPAVSWRHFGDLHGPGYVVYCYVSHSLRNMMSARTMTDEKIVRGKIPEFFGAALHNVPYLVLMAQDNKLLRPVDLYYKGEAAHESP